ncbi:MAG: DUF2284 domain-containing protein [Oscillospiraceae bacterium]|nr:DUF2284 domain-containing protein [Oscillospiraceae bacterium]
MDIFSKIEEIAVKCDFFETGYINIANLKYYPEVRKLCEANSCRNYAVSWACPPAIGTVAECKDRVDKYDKMLLFSRKYDLGDSFDFERITEYLLDFKQTVDIFDRNLKGFLKEYLLLSNEGCGRCAECTYPDAPCRFPQFLHHSLEGYGFMVNELAEEAGVHYNNGRNTVTFFGALLFNLK